MASKIKTDQPNNSYVEQGGAFIFTAWGITVAADNLDDAKRHALEFHGVNVDKDIPHVKHDEENS